MQLVYFKFCSQFAPKRYLKFEKLEKNSLLEELRWRGMLHDVKDGTAAQLNKEITYGYIGFDPTADSLHIGSLVPILLLVHLQKAGHKPFALIGGATGMVGDPSGKSEERNMLNEATLLANIEGIKKQLCKYLDFDSTAPNCATLVNNYDWFKNMSFLDFIRDTGKHITVNYMMAKESVKKRIEGTNGMSFTEFSYQLVQGYDFYWLYANKQCKLQMGGSDQWGNILTGTELIRRKVPGGEAYAFTCPLIKKADGGKFGKSEKGNIWLDEQKTSSYDFYQFWLNASDEDAANWVKIFTFLPKKFIDELITLHNTDASKRTLQKTLAKEITIFVHGLPAYENALATTELLFAGKNIDVQQLTDNDLQAIEGIVKKTISHKEFVEGIDLATITSTTGIFTSKGEARKMIIGGGLSLNKQKLTSPTLILNNDNLLYQKYLLFQKGKKQYYLIEIVN